MVVKSLIWLECSPDKETYIGIDKGSLNTPCANVRYWPKAALQFIRKTSVFLALRNKAVYARPINEKTR
jgi:hypothetical protein